MPLWIQCVIACIIFTIIILPPIYKDPLNLIASYPTVIRKRVESLPQYKDVIKPAEKKHITKKIVTAFILTILLAVIAYFSGATTFTSAFWHVFILFFSVNIYDTLVLDIGLFCHSKKTIIPGTEDMVDEYKSPWHHVKGAVIGTFLGTIVSLLSASYLHFMNIILKL